MDGFVDSSHRLSIWQSVIFCFIRLDTPTISEQQKRATSVYILSSFVGSILLFCLFINCKMNVPHLFAIFLYRSSSQQQQLYLYMDIVYLKMYANNISIYMVGVYCTFKYAFRCRRQQCPASNKTKIITKWKCSVCMIVYLSVWLTNRPGHKFVHITTDHSEETVDCVRPL